jgi:G3E family GTPase
MFGGLSPRSNTVKSGRPLKGEGQHARVVPVLIVSGFLGAGKSTLINSLIRASGEKWAIIENEIGAVSVDSLIVETRSEFFIELTDGCVCCRLRGDLLEALRYLHSKRESFDRILIETTGLADPEPILATFATDNFLRQNFELEGIVTLVDALNFNLNFERREFKAQIVYGDLLVISKTDRVDEEALSALTLRISELNPIATIYRSSLAEFNQSEVAQQALNVSQYRIRWRSLEGLPPQSFSASHGALRSSLIEVDVPLQRLLVMAYLMLFASTWHKELFRMKGVFHFHDEPKPWLLQVVHGEISWSMLDSVDDRFSSKSQIVVISDFSRLADFLRDGLELCRTKVADRIAVNSATGSVTTL